MRNFAWFIEDTLAIMGRPGALNELEDDLLFLRRSGIEKIVSLTLAPVNEDELERFSLEVAHIPVPDGAAPTIEQIEEFNAKAGKWLAAGKKVVVHCGAGYGRSGTMLACYLVGTGSTSGEAIRRVRRFRPQAIETREQEDRIAQYELHLRAKKMRGERDGSGPR